MIRKSDDNSRLKIKKLDGLLSNFLTRVEEKYKKNPCYIKDLWFEVLNNKFANMTEVVSFEKGTLTIKVKSSTLFSILNNYEKDHLLKKMQQKVSNKIIQQLIFKIG